MKKTILSIIGLMSFYQVSHAQWNTIGGNTLVNPTTDYLGTNTTHSLSIRTNATERLNIDPSGRFNFNNGFASSTNPLYNFGGGESEEMTITNYTSLRLIFLPPVTPYDIFKVQKVVTNQLPQTPVSVFKITHTGKIGINVENPQEMLHVHNGIIRVTGANSSGGPMIILGGNYTTQSGDWGMEYGTSTSQPSLKGLNFWKPSGSTNAGNYFLFLADNGNVGVGTDNPGSFKLAVEGKIGAREIMVTTTSPWPDYVFEKTYKKAELSEVEKYIQEHKHLPGIASANELQEKGGVDLGAMQVKQMEKIEELYLYVIDLKKEIAGLQKTIEESKTK